MKKGKKKEKGGNKTKIIKLKYFCMKEKEITINKQFRQDKHKDL